MGTTATNGARIRILRVLDIEGMLTTQELADKIDPWPHDTAWKLFIERFNFLRTGRP